MAVNAGFNTQYLGVLHLITKYPPVLRIRPVSHGMLTLIIVKTNYE